MSVTRRDVAQRCDRCDRVTLGTLLVAVVVAGPGAAADPRRLCTRCRAEVVPAAVAVLEAAP